ncbi:cell division protein SepF [Trueperella sp. LYQ143]|uniref:cell division protein SepF n=1 Tax=unclassified Trueperella TaxID=2630174 RepID=UPI0039836EBE
MGFLDKITAKAMPLEDSYEDYEDYAEYEDGEYYEDASVSTIHPVTQAPEVARIVTVWVSSYRDVKDFATEFRSGMPVILNLSEAADAERTRIVDFAVGLCFGLQGAFSRISDDVFLLSPHTVKIDAHGSESTHDYA